MWKCAYDATDSGGVRVSGCASLPRFKKNHGFHMILSLLPSCYGPVGTYFPHPCPSEVCFITQTLEVYGMDLT
jgi:hypothetical protein